MSRQTRSTPTLLFTVRLWTEDDPVAPQLRGSVRNVGTGAYRSLRRLSDLTAFLTEQLDEHPSRGAISR